MNANVRVRSWASSAVVLLALGAAAAACTEEKKVAATDPDAGADEPGRKQAALGGKLAAAVKAAESAQASPASKSEDGPPDKGVFAPGAADKALAPGAPPKVDLLGEGSDPKVSLAYAPDGGEQKTTVSAAFRMQGRGSALDYNLSIKIDKPKDKDKGKDEKKADAPASASYRVVATIAGLNLPPQLPKDAADQIGKIKGSEIRWQMASNGAITEVSSALAKGAEAGLDQLVNPIVESITLLTPVLPGKPVGVGAYWMVTDRLVSGIVDVVRYRVLKVEKIEKDKATLSMDVRQYAAKNEIDIGAGQKLSLLQFESLGKTKVEFAAPSLLSPRAEGQVRMALDGRVQGGQQAGQQGGLQTELTVRFAGAEPDRKK